MKSDFRFWAISVGACAVVMGLFVWGLLQWNLGVVSQQVADRLVLLGDLRRGAVQQYLLTAQAELRFWSSNREILGAQRKLLALWMDPEQTARARAAYLDNNTYQPGQRSLLEYVPDGSAYSELHRILHKSARLFVSERGYYDFFLVNPAGDVVYSVEKEVDFATNLREGPYSDTLLGEVFRAAWEHRHGGLIAVSDMQAYDPSNGAPAMFMATAMRDPSVGFVGVVAFQLPTNRILDIMNYKEGMGESGETYLVGQDLLMRSNSRFSEESTILRQRVETSTVEAALRGEEGVDMVRDYRGVEVISAYMPLPVAGGTWAVMAEIDSAETAKIAARERPSIAGALIFMYGLSLWSIWYWRNRRLPEETDRRCRLPEIRPRRSQVLRPPS